MAYAARSISGSRARRVSLTSTTRRNSMGSPSVPGRLLRDAPYCAMRFPVLRKRMGVFGLRDIQN
eukprot:3847313-Rhodomonas_salina.3